jgi:Epoxide hydrolase N terminus
MVVKSKLLQIAGQPARPSRACCRELGRCASTRATSDGEHGSVRNNCFLLGNVICARSVFLAAPEDILADLKRRLHNTRLPDGETAADWSQGVPRQRLRTLIDYWATQYDWRKTEALLNSYPQFRHRNRRPQYSLPACALAECRCAPADHDAWMAEHCARVHANHRAADEPDGAWRPSGGCLSSRAAIASRICIFRQARGA